MLHSTARPAFGCANTKKSASRGVPRSSRPQPVYCKATPDGAKAVAGASAAAAAFMLGTALSASAQEMPVVQGLSPSESTTVLVSNASDVGGAIKGFIEDNAPGLASKVAPPTVDVPNSNTPAQAQQGIDIPSVPEILEPLTKESSPAPGKGPIQALKESEASLPGSKVATVAFNRASQLAASPVVGDVADVPLSYGYDSAPDGGDANPGGPAAKTKTALPIPSVPETLEPLLREPLPNIPSLPSGQGPLQTLLKEERKNETVYNGEEGGQSSAKFLDSAVVTAGDKASELADQGRKYQRKAEDKTEDTKAAADSLANKAGRKAANALTSAKDSARGAADSAADSLNDTFKSGSGAVDTVKGAAGDAKDAASNGADKVKDAAKTKRFTLFNIGSKVSNAADDVADNVSDAAKDAKSAASSAADDVKDAAKDATRGSKFGLKDAKRAAEGAADDAKSAAKDATRGSKFGLKDAKRAVESAADDAKDAAKDVKFGAKDAKRAAESAGDQAKAGVNKAANKAAFSTSGLQRKAGNLADKAGNVADNVGDSVKDATKSGDNFLTSFLKKIN